MSNPNDIKFRYEGRAYIFKPPGAGRLGEGLGHLVFRDWPRFGDYVDHSYVTQDEKPMLYAAIEIWMKNGWQESIPLQDVIDGLE